MNFFLCRLFIDAFSVLRPLQGPFYQLLHARRGIYHKKHVINLYISNEMLPTWGFQKWHTINLCTSETLIYTHKRSNNIPEGTYQLQGSKCDTLSIRIYIYFRKGMLQICIYEHVINVQVIYHFVYTRRDKSCIYIYIYLLWDLRSCKRH
jgi:hypothetical protein